MKEKPRRYDILFLGIIYSKLYHKPLELGLKWSERYYEDFIKYCSNPQNITFNFNYNREKVIKELIFRGFTSVDIRELPSDRYFIMSNFSLSPNIRLVYLKKSFPKYYKKFENSIYRELGYIGFPGYTQIDYRIIKLKL